MKTHWKWLVFALLLIPQNLAFSEPYRGPFQTDDDVGQGVCERTEEEEKDGHVLETAGKLLLCVIIVAISIMVRSKRWRCAELRAEGMSSILKGPRYVPPGDDET